MLSLFWTLAIMLLAFLIGMIVPATILLVAVIVGVSKPLIVVAALAFFILAPVCQLLRRDITLIIQNDHAATGITVITGGSITDITTEAANDEEGIGFHAFLTRQSRGFAVTLRRRRAHD